MRPRQEAFTVEHLAETFARIPGVVAVTLGGSRAQGTHRDDSDWDFGLYYRGSVDHDALVGLGLDGHFAPPGEWGRLMNGGAWLRVDGQKVDVLYRDLDVVERWIAEAEEGRFEIDMLGGYLAGFATYVLAGEAALGKVLSGGLPRPTFPDALRESAGRRWLHHAAFSLLFADGYAARGHTALCTAMLAKAAIEVAQSRLAERGEWVLNEKGILPRAELASADHLLAFPGSRTGELQETVERFRVLLRLRPPSGPRADEVVR